MSISLAECDRLLAYDPDAGIFRWKDRGGRGCSWHEAGAIAGGVNAEGYRYIRIGKHQVRACRLAWALVHGAWPTHQIDHINRNTSDDRIANLREATGAQNKANSGVYRNNTSGFPGVYWDAGRGHWRAKGNVNGKRQWLGRFATKEEAYAAYLSCKRAAYGEFAEVA